MLACLNWNVANGQSSVTDIDLKNAYCVRVKLSTIATTKPLLQHFEITLAGTKNLQDLKNEYERLENDLRRMQAYAAIRTNVVGAVQYANAIVPAAASADRDINKTEQCSATCGNMVDQSGKPIFSKMDACAAKCQKENSEIVARLRSCEVPKWLPF